MSKEDFRQWCDNHELFSRFQVGSIGVFQIYINGNIDVKNWVISELQKFQMTGKIDDWYLVANAIKVFLKNDF